MTPVAVTGWGVLGGGPDQDVTGLYPELPHPAGQALTDFSIRGRLGRKGTGFFDRVTGLGVVACGLALDDSGIRAADGGLAVDRDRIGIVLGTTAGSLKSTMDFSAETLLQDRPYLVNPGLFPNTVMNCVAGQAAIWYGLRGVNATVAGGPLALLNVLRYARRLLTRGYADVLLAGVAEEFTPHTAWTRHLAGVAPPREGAVVFVLEPAPAARAAGRPAGAELLAVATGFCPDPGGVDAALGDCARRAIAEAGVDAASLAQAAAARSPGADASTDSQPVGAGLELAAWLTAARDGDDDHDEDADDTVLITAATPEGGVGAAVLRGCRRAGGHHR